MSSDKKTSERFILMPPAVQAIAALATHDNEEPDGIPDYGNRNLAGVHCRRDGDVLTFEASNGRIAGRYVQDTSIGYAPVVEDGKFPDIDSVMPKGEPVLTVRVGPTLLMQLLNACVAVDDYGPVTLTFYGPDKVIKIHTRNEYRHREFTGLMMPCALPKEGE